MSPQSPTDSTTNSISDSSRSTPSPKKSNFINLDWEKKDSWIIFSETATTSVGLPQTTTPDERRLELELKLAEAATAKMWQNLKRLKLSVNCCSFKIQERDVVMKNLWRLTFVVR
jgi:hypothetical protein